MRDLTRDQFSGLVLSLIAAPRLKGVIIPEGHAKMTWLTPNEIRALEGLPPR